MPIVQNNYHPKPPNGPAIPQTDRPAAQPVRHHHGAYRGVTVDTAYRPRQNLIMHVEGHSWTVNYYSQLLGMDDAPQGQGLGTLGINQQYKLIQGMEIKVQSPLTPSQDNATKEMSYEGSAIVYPFVVPNEGDIFLADIGDGREGVFQITSSERKSIFRETCHEINYKLLDYSDNGRIEDLRKKTVQTYYFERDFIKHGANPILMEEVYENFLRLQKAYTRLIDLFLHRFYSREFTTFCVPDRGEYTYDPFHVRGWNAHFGRWDTHTFKHIRVLNADEDPAMTAFSFWDAVAHRDRGSLDRAFRMVGLVDISEFDRRSYYDGIRFSGFKKTIYPADPMPNAQHGLGWHPKKVKPFTPVVLSPGPRRISDFMAVGNTTSNTVQYLPTESFPNPVWVEKVIPVCVACNQHKCCCAHVLPSLPHDAYPPTHTNIPPLPVNPKPVTVDANGMVVVPVIHPAMSEGYYIFSRAFWENDRTPGRQSKLELIVQDFFDDKIIAYDRLLEVLDDSHRWNATDSFYYIPVLLVMMKTVVLTY